MASCGVLPTRRTTWHHDKAMLALDRSSSYFRMHHQPKAYDVCVRSMPTGDEEKGTPLNPSGNQLTAIIRCAHRRSKAWLVQQSMQNRPLLLCMRRVTCHRRKQQQIENQLKELGMDALQERLEDAAETPAKPPYRLARLIQVILVLLTGGISCRIASHDGNLSCHRQVSACWRRLDPLCPLCRISGCKQAGLCWSWRL